MFLFCWYFDLLCKFEISNELWYIDKISFSLYFAYFFSCIIKEWILKLAYASQYMQNMAVDSLIENKNCHLFHLINSMAYRQIRMPTKILLQEILQIVSRHLIYCFGWKWFESFKNECARNGCLWKF